MRTRCRRIAIGWMTSIGLAAVPACAEETPIGGEDYEAMRERMVAQQIEARGVRDPRVLAALGHVERHRFVPESLADQAYDDRPLPIGSRQTISQPYIVAAMTEAIDPQPEDVVLEVGTGSGYQAAVLARLVRKVYSIEIIPELAERAKAVLAEQGYDNVEVVVGDGWAGLPHLAPFDGIVVTAAPEKVPEPLVTQLAVGAKLVIPVGEGFQELQVLEKTPDGIVTQTLFPVRFVPMTGRAQQD